MRAPSSTAERARGLRREMSLPEVILWSRLRRGQMDGLRFRRQHPLGRCVLDFYCPAAKVAIEVDGAAHDLAERAERDGRRDAWLREQDVTTIRVQARDVLDDETLDAVLTMIAEACGAAKPS